MTLLSYPRRFRERHGVHYHRFADQLGDGCLIQFEVGGSGLVNVTCGDTGSDGFEFTFGSEALREFLRLGGEALREMDASYALEKAEDSPPPN